MPGGECILRITSESCCLHSWTPPNIIALPYLVKSVRIVFFRAQAVLLYLHQTKMSIMAATTEAFTITPSPFPARSKTASSRINGKETTATSMSFSDKILITVTQEGRLAHWVNPH
jgi:hypothetical protein